VQSQTLDFDFGLWTSFIHNKMSGREMGHRHNGQFAPVSSARLKVSGVLRAILPARASVVDCFQPGKCIDRLGFGSIRCHSHVIKLLGVPTDNRTHTRSLPQESSPSTLVSQFIDAFTIAVLVEPDQTSRNVCPGRCRPNSRHPVE